MKITKYKNKATGEIFTFTKSEGSWSLRATDKESQLELIKMSMTGKPVAKILKADYEELI